MNPSVSQWFNRLMATDKRLKVRHRSPAVVAYYWEGSQSEAHEIKDASATGLYVLTEQRWYPGTVVTMTLQRTNTSEKDPQRALTVKGRVVRAGADGVGFAFELPRPGRQSQSTDMPDEVSMKSVETFLKHAQDDMGQALFEYGILLPVVFLLIVNILNMGGFFFAWITVANTARAAADYAALAGASAGSIQPASPTLISNMVTAEASSLPNNPSIVLDICRKFNGTVTTVSGTCTSIPADTEPTSYVLTSVDIYYTYKPFISAGFQFPKLNVYVTIPPTSIHRRTVMRTLQ